MSQSPFEQLQSRVLADDLAVLVLDTWQTPATAYPDGRSGRVELRTISYARGMYHHYRVPDAAGVPHAYYQARWRLRVKTLRIDNKVWMVDDPPHHHAMLDHARHYHGTVLVAGLGLGLIVHALHANPAVRRIVVVERSQDVINLVAPHVPHAKLTIVQADWHAGPVAHPDGGTWDGVFYDLFVGDGWELLPAGLVVMMHLRRDYPGAVQRIHGFDNDGMHRMLAGMDTLRAQAEAMWHVSQEATHA